MMTAQGMMHSDMHMMHRQHQSNSPLSQVFETKQLY
jgi:hypothetical protein